MKKLFIVLFFAIAATANAQVNKMFGLWNTFDDKTGDMASCVEITENNGTYSCVVLNMYSKNADGTYRDIAHPITAQFRAEVEEAVLADMLLIVLDASRDDFMMCWETTRGVLEQLEAFEKPRLVLLNKMDAVTEQALFAINAFALTGERFLKVSVRKDPDMGAVLKEIAEMLV